MDLDKFLRYPGARDPCDDKERFWPGEGVPNKADWRKLLEDLDPKDKPSFRSAVDKWLKNGKNEPSQVLCIHGEWGRGKTTMMMAMTEDLVAELPESTPGIRIVQQLQLRGKTKPEPTLSSYFFFQRNDNGRNNVVAALKSLIYQLINQSKDLDPKVDLMKYVSKYADPRSSIFNSPAAVYVLRNILHDILKHDTMPKVYLLIDALDECSLGLSHLVDTITDQSNKANWLVTTSQDDIVQDLRTASALTKMEFKPNPSNVSDLIDSNIQRLFRMTPESKFKDATKKFLVEKSDSSFLWMGLACKALDLGLLQADTDDFRSLEPGLKPLYEKVMEKILSKAQGDAKRLKFLKDIFHWVVFSYRPLHLKELHALMDSDNPQQDKPQQELLKSLTLWAPLLTIYQDTIYFTHQSARDYLSSYPFLNLDYHWIIATKCLKQMQRYLRKDIFDQALIDTKNKKNETKDSLESIEYACCNWVDHLTEFLEAQKKSVAPSEEKKKFFSDNGAIHEFFRDRFLHWLVALCMMGKGFDSIHMLTTLDSKLPKEAPQLHRFIHDAKRFILFNRLVIEEAPLQLYTSAIIFAPHMSTIKKEGDKPSGLSISMGLRNYWNPLANTLTGHDDWVKTVAFSLDSKLVASGSDDRTVKLWDAITGAECATLRGHLGSINSIAFSRDGKLLASSSSDHTVKFWKADTGAEVTELAITHSISINSVAFSRDSKLVALASDNQTIEVWDVQGKHQLPPLEGHSSWVTDVVFSPDERRLASCSGDETVRIWNIPTGATDNITEVDSSSSESSQIILEGHSGPVNSVTFSPVDFNLLASASGDQTVILWNIMQETTTTTFIGHSDPVNSVAFSPDGQLLASASDDMTVRLWSVEFGIAYGILKGHSSWIRAISFSCDGTLASASDDQTIKIWDTEMGKIQRAGDEHSDSVTAVAFSPEERYWYASASEDQTIKLWDRETGVVFATLEGHSDTINSVVFSPNGELIASCSDDTTIRLWNTSNIEALRKETGLVIEKACRIFNGHDLEVNSIAFSPNNKLVASGSSDERVILWDIETEKKLTIISHSEIVRVVAFSQDTDNLLVASASNDGEVKLWRKAKKAPNSTTLGSHEDWIKDLGFSNDAKEKPDSEPTTFSGHDDWVRAIAFSNDAKLLASGSDDGKVKIWSAAKESRDFPKTLKGHDDWVRTVAFSPKSELLVSGSDDNTIILWDVATGKNQHVFNGHSDQINSVNVSFDDKLVLSASNDMTVKVWEIGTGKVSTLEEHSDRVNAAVFSPKGQQIVSISDDKTVKLWDTVRRELIAPLDGDPGPVNRVEFSPKGDLVASLSDNGIIRLWDLTGKEPKMLKDHFGPANCIAFLLLPGSSDPKQLQVVTSGWDDTTIRLWDMGAGTVDKELAEHQGRVNFIAYSPVSDLLVSASDDKKVMVWDRQRGELKFSLEHPNKVKFVDFLEDKIVFASDDNKVWIWDAGQGTKPYSLENREDLVTAVAISRDKTIIATAAEDNKVKIWSFKKGRAIWLETVPTYGSIRKLSFPENAPYLDTDRGRLRAKCLSLPALRNNGSLISLPDPFTSSGDLCKD